MSSETNQIKEQLFTARTEAFEQTRTVNFFKSFVAVLVVAILTALLICILNYVAAQTHVRSPFDNKEARNRIAELEKQLNILKSDLTVVREPDSILTAVRPALSTAAANWALISFVAALLAALYIKVRYKITYFESYRDLATKKMLSDFYRELGDRMMLSGELGAAEKAYQDALTINPTNINATYGIAKARVFQPLGGEEEYAGDVADEKLNYLIDHPIRHANKHDAQRESAQLFFLKSLNRRTMDDDTGNEEWLEKTLQADPNLPWHGQTSELFIKDEEKLNRQLNVTKRPLTWNQVSALANVNLGTVYLDAIEFEKAIFYLDRAAKFSPTLITHLSLGQAYLYGNKFDDALKLHLRAVRRLEEPDIADDRYVWFGACWEYSYMPLKRGDTQTIQSRVSAPGFVEKRIIALGMLAFSYALLGKFAEADKYFAEAWLPDEWPDCSRLFLNRIRSILNLVTMDAKARNWFESNEILIQASHPIN